MERALDRHLLGERCNWERIESRARARSWAGDFRAATGKELKAVERAHAQGRDPPQAATGKELKVPQRRVVDERRGEGAATGKELKALCSFHFSEGVRKQAATGKELKGTPI